MSNTYRAAYWTDGQSDVRLTSESQKELPDDELLHAALMEARFMELMIDSGKLVIGEYTE